MQGTMMAKKTLSMTLIALLLSTGPSLLASRVPVDEVLADTTVACTLDFSVDCPLETWHTILDNLSLMAALWKIYRFQPAYRVSQDDTGLHVVDPTGIVGDLWQVGRTDLS